MSDIGFSEVYKSSLVFELNDGIRFNVISLPGLLILKFVAWSERSLITRKDGEDINYLLRNYSSINPESLFDDNPDLIDQEGYNFYKAGAKILARNVKAVLINSYDLIELIADIAVSETSSIETSKLANVDSYGNSVKDNFANLVAFKDEFLTENIDK